MIDFGNLDLRNVKGLKLFKFLNFVNRYSVLYFQVLIMKALLCDYSLVGPLYCECNYTIIMQIKLLSVSIHIQFSLVSTSMIFIK